MNVLSDESFELTDDAFDVGLVIVGALRQLETKTHLDPIDLHTHRESVHGNLTKGRLRRLGGDVVLSDRGGPWVVRGRKLQGVHAAL